MDSFTSFLPVEQTQFAAAIRSVFSLMPDSPSDPQEAADLKKEQCVSEEPSTTVREQKALESWMSFPAQKAGLEAGNTKY